MKAPDGVTSIAAFDSPLKPYFFRNGAGIVTRPRVENLTRQVVSVFIAQVDQPNEGTGKSYHNRPVAVSYRLHRLAARR